MSITPCFTSSSTLDEGREIESRLWILADKQGN
jgi:hypothetical protein